MTGIVINMSWEYFLALLGTLIGIAYYSNGRFTALETTVEWMKEMLTEMALNSENKRAKLFKNGSPVCLTAAGRSALQRSGLKSYIDANKNRLIAYLDDANL